MDYFKIEPDIPTSEYVDSKNKIRDYMIEAGLASKNTIDKRIAFFKKCMYYCSSCHANPAFYILAKDALGLSDELINIHELMYKFFVKEQHCLNFTVLAQIDDKYDPAPSSFSWHISPIIMPFFTACISASGLCNVTANMTISDFFVKLNDEFKMTVKYSLSCSNTSSAKEKLSFLSHNLDDVFEQWTDTVLGKSYFCKLESIYKNYSWNERQKTDIQISIYSLTRILIENPVSSDKISQYVTTMLDKYRFHLSQDIKFNTKELYPYKFPRKIPEEPAFIKGLYETFSQSVKKVLTFISTYKYEPHSKYKISVSDFDSFQGEYNQYYEQLSEITNSVNNNLSNFFRDAKRRHDKPPSINFNDINAKKHIAEISSTICNYYKKIQKSFGNFLSVVKKASSPNPEKYDNLAIDHDYLEELERNIYLFLNQLRKTLKKNISSLPDILNCYNPGAVNMWKYPTDLFDEDDIIRIINELSPEYSPEPQADKIIALLKTKNVRFPMLRASVITFLQKYDEIITQIQ